MGLYEKIRKDFPDRKERERFLRRPSGRMYLSGLLLNEINKTFNKFEKNLEKYLDKNFSC